MSIDGREGYVLAFYDGVKATCLGGDRLAVPGDPFATIVVARGAKPLAADQVKEVIEACPGARTIKKEADARWCDEYGGLASGEDLEEILAPLAAAAALDESREDEVRVEDRAVARALEQRHGWSVRAVPEKRSKTVLSEDERGLRGTTWRHHWVAVRPERVS